MLNLTFVLWCLMPLSKNISVISWRVSFIGGGEDTENNIDLSQVTDKLLSHNVVHLPLIEIRTHNISSDCIGSCKFNYHTIMATTSPYIFRYKYSLIMQGEATHAKSYSLHFFLLNTKTMSLGQHFYDIIIVSSTKIMISNNDILNTNVKI